MEQEERTWEAFRWYCPNCSNLVMGFINGEGQIKAGCDRCKTYMVMTPKGRRRDILEIRGPKGTFREPY